MTTKVIRGPMVEMDNQLNRVRAQKMMDIAWVVMGQKLFD